eukprot:2868162-Alexandrium_andersonii.AAC.1
MGGTVALPALPLLLKFPCRFFEKRGGQGQEEPPATGRYSFACPAGCGTVRWATARPLKEGSRFPKWWCQGCEKSMRIGNWRCCACSLTVAKC